MGELDGGKFDGKVSIITGAGQGIGEGYAHALARAGASVVVADINDENAANVVAAIEAEGGTALAVHVDVSDPDSCIAMAAATVERFGRIDHLVNNAAIYHSMEINGLLRIDLDYYRKFMDVNMNGAIYATRAVWRELRKQEGAAVVNQSSTAAWMAAGFYGVAKAALNSITINLAAEMASMGIRVNAIAPGPTNTEATQLISGGEENFGVLLGDVMIKRPGTPEDMANMLIFLLSDDSSWITGQIFAVDGGQSKRI